MIKSHLEKKFGHSSNIDVIILRVGFKMNEHHSDGSLLNVLETRKPRKVTQSFFFFLFLLPFHHEFPFVGGWEPINA